MASGLVVKDPPEPLRAFPRKGTAAFAARGFRGPKKLQALLYLLQNGRVFHRAQIAGITPFRHGLKGATQ